MRTWTHCASWVLRSRRRPGTEQPLSVDPILAKAATVCGQGGCESDRIGQRPPHLDLARSGEATRLPGPHPLCEVLPDQVRDLVGPSGISTKCELCAESSVPGALPVPIPGHLSPSIAATVSVKHDRAGSGHHLNPRLLESVQVVSVLSGEEPRAGSQELVEAPGPLRGLSPQDEVASNAAEAGRSRARG
jgi:hypothetical protein